jgi:hypothetical protein
MANNYGYKVWQRTVEVGSIVVCKLGSTEHFGMIVRTFSSNRSKATGRYDGYIVKICNTDGSLYTAGGSSEGTYKIWPDHIVRIVSAEVVK